MKKLLVMSAICGAVLSVSATAGTFIMKIPASLLPNGNGGCVYCMTPSVTVQVHVPGQCHQGPGSFPCGSVQTLRFHGLSKPLQLDGKTYVAKATFNAGNWGELLHDAVTNPAYKLQVGAGTQGGSFGATCIAVQNNLSPVTNGQYQLHNVVIEFSGSLSQYGCVLKLS